jgi:hypothetical protein
MKSVQQTFISQYRPDCSGRAMTPFRRRFLRKPRPAAAEVSPPSSSVAEFGGSQPSSHRESRCSHGGAIERHRSPVSRPAALVTALRCRTGPRIIRTTLRSGGVLFSLPATSPLCAAPCPPCLLPDGRLARDRRGLIDGLIWPQDGCASIVLPQWRRRDFLPLR